MNKKTLQNGLVAMLLWASAFPGIRAGLAAYRPLDLILLRFTVAVLFLFFFLIRSEKKWPERADLPRFVLLGFLGITAYQIPLNYGQLTVPSGTASLIINTAPLWAAIFSWAAFGDRLNTRQIMGLGLGFFGVALIALGHGGPLSVSSGIWLVFLAALSHSASFIVQKPLLRKYAPLTVTAFTVLFGVIWLIPWSVGTMHTIRHAPLSSTLVVVYLGIFPAGIAYILWNRVVAALPVARAASFLYLVPPLSLVMAWFWHSEVPSLMSLIGGAVALVGVALVLKADARA